MHRERIVSIVLAGALVALGVAMSVQAQEEEDTTDPRILAYDKGPARIDVSKYPADMQAHYKLFSTKCGTKCHKLSRPINCELVLPEDWESYIKRMMRKAGSYIAADEAKQIYDFLVFDSQTRKKDMYEKALKAAGTAGG